MGGGSSEGTRAEPLSRPGPCASTVTPKPFVSPKAAFSRCCRGVTNTLDRKWGNRKKRPPPSAPRAADLGLTEGREVLGAAVASGRPLPLPLARLQCLGWLRRSPMEAVPPPPPPRESQQVAPALCPQAREAHEPTGVFQKKSHAGWGVRWLQGPQALCLQDTPQSVPFAWTLSVTGPLDGG